MSMPPTRCPIDRSRWFAAGGLLALLLPGIPLAAHADGHGKQVFLDARCDRCHGVGSAGIEASKARASDLGTVGASRESAWMRDYLERKVEIAGKPHPVAWKGSDAELEALVAWLAILE